MATKKSSAGFLLHAVISQAATQGVRVVERKFCSKAEPIKMHSEGKSALLFAGAWRISRDSMTGREVYGVLLEASRDIRPHRQQEPDEQQ